MSSAPSKKTSSSLKSAVPEPIARLVAVFGEHLADVEFPTVDAARLRDLAQLVEANAATVEQAQLALSAAREAHASAYAELSRLAKQGLGYARVYAADDETLGTALSEINLGPTRKPPMKKAKRKARAARDNGVTKLPFAEAASGAA